MRNLLTKLYVNLQSLKDESGQDLIEYCIVAAVVVVAAAGASSSLVSAIGTAVTKLTTAITNAAV